MKTARVLVFALGVAATEHMTTTILRTSTTTSTITVPCTTSASASGAPNKVGLQPVQSYSEGTVIEASGSSASEAVPTSSLASGSDVVSTVVVSSSVFATIPAAAGTGTGALPSGTGAGPAGTSTGISPSITPATAAAAAGPTGAAFGALAAAMAGAALLM